MYSIHTYFTKYLNNKDRHTVLNWILINDYKAKCAKSPEFMSDFLRFYDNKHLSIMVSCNK